MGTTIRDVARAAEVSIGTVPRALKNQPGLSEATRARIVEIAQRLGYDPAQLRPRIRRLTFLLHRQHNRFPASPFFSHVLHGVEDACRERGVVPTLLTAVSYIHLRAHQTGRNLVCRLPLDIIKPCHL